jgi:hypothetical protein
LAPFASCLVLAAAGVVERQASANGTCPWTAGAEPDGKSLLQVQSARVDPRLGGVKKPVGSRRAAELRPDDRSPVAGTAGSVVELTGQADSAGLSHKARATPAVVLGPAVAAGAAAIGVAAYLYYAFSGVPCSEQGTEPESAEVGPGDCDAVLLVTAFVAFNEGFAPPQSSHSAPR